MCCGRIDHVEGGNLLGCSLPGRRSRTATPISRRLDESVSSHSRSIAMSTFVREAHRDLALARDWMSLR